MTQNLHNKIAPHITEIIARLQDAGFEAYIVGGAVRDFLLGREPKDYDISIPRQDNVFIELFNSSCNNWTTPNNGIAIVF